jgi:hypothetical protein
MRKVLMLFVGFVFVLFMTAFVISAQGQIILGRINGIVTDSESGLPIDKVTVTATIGSLVNGTATTNSSGYYVMTGLNGNFTGIIYNVTAQKTGYYPSTVPVAMVSSIDFVISVTQNFTLTPMTTTTSTPSPTIPEIPATETLLLFLILTATILLFHRLSTKVVH